MLPAEWLLLINDYVQIALCLGGRWVASGHTVNVSKGRAHDNSFVRDPFQRLQRLQIQNRFASSLQTGPQTDIVITRSHMPGGISSAPRQHWATFIHPTFEVDRPSCPFRVHIALSWSPSRQVRKMDIVRRTHLFTKASQQSLPVVETRTYCSDARILYSIVRV